MLELDLLKALFFGVIIAGIAGGLILLISKSETAKIIFAGFCGMILLFSIYMATAEERTVFVKDFDFATSEVILVDEDGFSWTCPIGTHSWILGEEYVLVLEAGEEPAIAEAE